MRWPIENASMVVSACLVLASITMLAAAIFWRPPERIHDPVFVCSKGKHFVARYVDDVATLGCFPDSDIGL